MRMWMINPKLLCNKHLLGEHGEIHKHRHNFVKGHKVDGRLSPVVQIEPSSMQSRHDELAEEMLDREMNHKSPYEQPSLGIYKRYVIEAKVDTQISLDDLCERCEECRNRIKEYDNMETVKVKYDACPSTSGSEGHGQGVKYQDRSYFYRTGKDIPKNKVAMLTWEGLYCGNIHGEKEWILVAWNGNDFTVLEHIGYNVREDMKKYKGKTAEECIALRTKIIEHDNKKHQEWIDSQTSCKYCGKGVLVFENDQEDDVCYDCYRGLV